MTTDEARRERELRIEAEAVQLRSIGTDIIDRLDAIEPKLATTTKTARKARRTARALVVAVLALAVVAATAGIATFRVVHLQSCVTSWATAQQSRQNALSGTTSAVIGALGEVSAILATANATGPTPELRARYKNAIVALDAAEKAYAKAQDEHPNYVVAAKLDC